MFATNLWCIFAFHSSRALLGLHIIEALNCFRLRLGFDLFSHSFHNLIKKALVLLQNGNNDDDNDGQQKKVAVYGRRWRNGEKDEHMHCVWDETI